MCNTIKSITCVETMRLTKNSSQSNMLILLETIIFITRFSCSVGNRKWFILKFHHKCHSLSLSHHKTLDAFENAQQPFIQNVNLVKNVKVNCFFLPLRILLSEGFHTFKWWWQTLSSIANLYGCWRSTFTINSKVAKQHLNSSFLLPIYIYI